VFAQLEPWLRSPSGRRATDVAEIVANILTIIGFFIAVIGAAAAFFALYFDNLREQRSRAYDLISGTVGNDRHKAVLDELKSVIGDHVEIDKPDCDFVKLKQNARFILHAELRNKLGDLFNYYEIVAIGWTQKDIDAKVIVQTMGVYLNVACIVHPYLRAPYVNFREMVTNEVFWMDQCGIPEACQRLTGRY
jgi:hypothetical protein